MAIVALFSLLLFATVSAQTSQCGLSTVCYALDESGSIDANEFDTLRTFTVNTARSLKSSNPAAQFAAVTFSTDAVLIQSTTPNVETEFVPAIQGHSQRGGGTNIDDGLSTCFTELNKTTADVRLIILVTDGVGSVSQSTIDNIQANNILILSVGVGNNIDEAQLKDIASTPDLFIKTTFQDVGSLIDPLVDAACAEANCRSAFDTCEFTFEGVTAVPTYNASGPQDVGFTPNIIAKDPSIYLGTLNMNNVIPEFIDSKGATDINNFAVQNFSKTQFKPWPSGRSTQISHETYQSQNQTEEAKNRCVRVFFSDIELLSAPGGNTIGHLNNVPESQNKCVVFRTAP